MEHMYDQSVLMFLVFCFLFWFQGRAAEVLRADEIPPSPYIPPFLEVFGSPWRQLILGAHPAGGDEASTSLSVSAGIWGSAAGCLE